MNNSRWNGFSSLSSILPGSIFGAKKEKEPITASMDVVSATDRADAKRRRSPQMDIDDESPNAKRAKRSSPPLAARIRTEPPRRARSVKALVILNYSLFALFVLNKKIYRIMATYMGLEGMVNPSHSPVHPEVSQRVFRVTWINYTYRAQVHLPQHQH